MDFRWFIYLCMYRAAFSEAFGSARLKLPCKLWPIKFYCISLSFCCRPTPRTTVTYAQIINAVAELYEIDEFSSLIRFVRKQKCMNLFRVSNAQNVFLWMTFERVWKKASVHEHTSLAPQHAREMGYSIRIRFSNRIGPNWVPVDGRILVCGRVGRRIMQPAK